MPPKTALVLGGGGARAAYEAGVLRYLATGLPKDIRRKIRFDIIVGTSSGAINGAFMAAGAAQPLEAAVALADRWCKISMHDIYRVRGRTYLQLVRLVLGGGLLQDPALLDVSAVYQMVNEEIDWSAIDRCISTGCLDAFAVSATEVATSRNIVFIHGSDSNMPLWKSKNPYIRPRSVSMRAEHVLASASIPILFPPVQVEGRYYLDGGLRQNTPLRPALRLGAERMLVFSLRKVLTVEEGDRLSEERCGVKPTWGQVIGKTMNAVLLDRAGHEVERLERINKVLRWGNEEFGEPFDEGYGQIMTDNRGAAYQEVQCRLIAPGHDIGRMAQEYVMGGHLSKDVEPMTRRILMLFARMGTAGENDVLSYLVFDPAFLESLVKLGEQDAADMHDELCAFFSFD